MRRFLCRGPSIRLKKHASEISGFHKKTRNITLVKNQSARIRSEKIDILYLFSGHSLLISDPYPTMIFLLLFPTFFNQCIAILESLRAHCKRLQNKTSDTDVQTSLKIVFEKDLKLTLYRHWTVEHSLKYSMFTAVRLKLWTLKGDKKIHQLLADMGYLTSFQKYFFLLIAKDFPGFHWCRADNNSNQWTYS